jgi:hypothetical protein
MPYFYKMFVVIKQYLWLNFYLINYLSSKKNALSLRVVKTPTSTDASCVTEEHLCWRVLYVACVQKCPLASHVRGGTFMLAGAYVAHLHKCLLVSHVRGGAFVLAVAYVAHQHRTYYIKIGHARNFSKS